ncbi:MULTISPECIES: hypothetical protein [Bacillus]|uniref:hypothetical protein n=1 Tax=Bacillus pseudomycoides TaxID=64104 RepID=UPI0001A18854|nr:hypothetical protein [Bacillus pseudomycoides]EEM13551.1 hypothetical protein bpmyx0001_56210 [Bacillus pseudomycoides DSM 12442]MED1599374.1 hypothetical protein [Bacillus pseudomycoides]MED4713174.1 hypothetical protein [Bacillus pseudomycoides]
MALFNEKEMNRGVEKKSKAKTSLELPKQEKKPGGVVKIKGFQEKKEAQPTVAPLREEEMPVKKKKKNLMQHLGKKKDVVKKTARIDEDSGSKGKTEKKKKIQKEREATSYQKEYC